MGIEFGRVSGPLLSANLLRNGIDLAFESTLLYLDVVHGRIGIKTDVPSQTLTISGTSNASNLIATTQADIANLTFVSNSIQNVTNKIYITPNQAVDPTIVVNELRTANLKFRDSSVINYIDASDITLASNGSGRVVFSTSQLKVQGNLHATGDITFDGTITFGSDSSDAVAFNADVTSNIIPNTASTYDLGAVGKAWNNLYATTVVNNAINTTNAVVNDINLLLPQGHTIYVSIHGDDSHVGNHLHATFRTLKHALSVATTGDNIVIFPGTYTEDFPLTVPAGVGVTGSGIRAVTIQPSTGTNNKDAFLLNGETTVSNLAVVNFYYDSTADTGYAFRFANGYKSTTRSAYVQNVSVITKGSVVSSKDPLGFLQGDAGRGALVDGSVVDPTSSDAAMLFNTNTYIVPNGDGLTITNGARAEWLNSFTYFANRGLHLVRGTLGFASLGIKFRTELRSIGSANVYGNFGAVADGVDTLAYLVGHNFGYIGTAADSQNDYGLVIQANEVVEFNSGKIYYDSMDHKGDYRIGDIFYINQTTGQVSFNAQALSFAAGGSIVLEGPAGQVVITAGYVQVTNIRIHDNTIESIFGPVNLQAASGTTTLTTDVAVTGNLGVTGDVLVKGNVFLGNSPLDVVSIVPNLTQTIKPDLNSAYTLGSGGITPKVWRNAYLTSVNIDGTTQLTNNTISTLTSGTDLQLVAAGTGQIQILTTDVSITNNMLVNGTTAVGNLIVLGDVNTHTGSYLLTGNSYRTGNTDITGHLTQLGSFTNQFQDVQIAGNNITTTVGNNDLELQADGVGIVKVLSNNVQINHDLTVLGTGYLNAVGVTTTITAAEFDTGNINIISNYVTTALTNNNLELRANNTGTVYAPTNSVSVIGDLTVTGTTTVNGTSSLKNVELVGLTTLTGDINQTGDIGITGNIISINNITGRDYLQSSKINITTNTVSATDTDADLLFTANGSGGVVLDSRLKITDNIISNVWASATTDLQKSIKFSPNGTGNTVISSTKSVQIPYGNSGNKVLSALGEIRENSTTKLFEGFTTSGLLTLGSIIDTDRNTYIIPELTIGANDNTLQFVNNSILRATIDSIKLSTNTVDIDNIRLNGNTVSNTLTGTDLVLANNGSGFVNINNLSIAPNDIQNNTNNALTFTSTGIGYVKFAGTFGVVIPTGTTLERPAAGTAEVGEVRHNTTLNYMEVFDGTRWIPAVGTLGAAPLEEVLDIMDFWSLILG